MKLNSPWNEKVKSEREKLWTMLIKWKLLSAFVMEMEKRESFLLSALLKKERDWNFLHITKTIKREEERKNKQDWKGRNPNTIPREKEKSEELREKWVENGIGKESLKSDILIPSPLNINSRLLRMRKRNVEEKSTNREIFFDSHNNVHMNKSFHVILI